MEKKNVEKEKSNGEILFTSFVLTAYANVTTCLAFYTSRGHVASSSSPKSVGQVVFVVFVLLLYDSLSLVRVVIKVQTACRYISHSLPLLGAPFLFKSKKLSCLAFSSPCIL